MSISTFESAVRSFLTQPSFPQQLNYGVADVFEVEKANVEVQVVFLDKTKFNRFNYFPLMWFGSGDKLVTKFSEYIKIDENHKDKMAYVHYPGQYKLQMKLRTQNYAAKDVEGKYILITTIQSVKKFKK